MSKVIVATQASLEELSIPKLVIFFNEMTGSEVKRFPTKTKGIARILKAQAELKKDAEEVGTEVAKVVVAKEKAKKVEPKKEVKTPAPKKVAKKRVPMPKPEVITAASNLTDAEWEQKALDKILEDVELKKESANSLVHRQAIRGIWIYATRYKGQTMFSKWIESDKVWQCRFTLNGTTVLPTPHRLRTKANAEFKAAVENLYAS